MVRTTYPLQEKMTLFWHDHFATADQDAPLMLRQNRMLRRRGLGSWVQGTRAASGILTDFPSLTALDRDDNLKVTVDFRRVSSSLIEGWLRTDAAEVIPNADAYGRLALVR